MASIIMGAPPTSRLHHLYILQEANVLVSEIVDLGITSSGEFGVLFDARLHDDAIKRSPISRLGHTRVFFGFLRLQAFT